MHSSKQPPENLKFVHEYTELLAAAGLTRSAGKVLSYLIICHPPKKTARDLQQTLGLSSGSVSMATTLLAQAKLINEIKLPNERKLYYEVKPDAFTRSIEQRVQLSAAVRKLAERELESDPNNPRLINMRDTYELLEKAIVSTFQSLNTERKK